MTADGAFDPARQIESADSKWLDLFNLLKTEHRLVYLKAQSVPRCKHFLSRLPISLCCKWHKSLFTQHINTKWAERTIFEC
jgi:hypothetical protein